MSAGSGGALFVGVLATVVLAIEAQSPYSAPGAGIVLRVTEQGLLQLKRLIPVFIENAFTDANPQDVFHFIHNHRLVNFTSMHVAEFKEPMNLDVRFTNDPNGPIMIDVKDTEFTISMLVHMGLKRVKVGKGKMEIKNFRLRTALKISADSQGYPMLLATHCEVNLRKVIYHFESFRLAISEPHRIQNAMKADLLNNFCDAVLGRGFQTVNGNIRRTLAETKIFDVDFDAEEEMPKNLYDLLKLMGPQSRQKFVNFAERLYLNLALVAEPRMTASPAMLEMQIDGKAVMKHMAPAPFRPHAFPTSYYNPGRLVNVYISESTIQSLLYYVYKSGLLDFTLSQTQTPFLEGFLATSCSGICLGSIIPELRKEYPNSHTEINIKALAPLSASIINGRGTITGKFSTILTATKDRKRVPILSAIATPTIAYKLRPITVSMRGEATVTDLKLTLLNSTLKSISNANLRALAKGAKVFMSKFINGFAAGGLPMPKLPFGSWHSLTLKPMNHVIYLEYDFVPNQEAIQKLVNDLFSKRLFSYTVRPFDVAPPFVPNMPIPVRR